MLYRRDCELFYYGESHVDTCSTVIIPKLSLRVTLEQILINTYWSQIRSLNIQEFISQGTQLPIIPATTGFA